MAMSLSPRPPPPRGTAAAGNPPIMRQVSPPSATVGERRVRTRLPRLEGGDAADGRHHRPSPSEVRAGDGGARSGSERQRRMDAIKRNRRRRHACEELSGDWNDVECKRKWDELRFERVQQKELARPLVGREGGRGHSVDASAEDRPADLQLPQISEGPQPMASGGLPAVLGQTRDSDHDAPTHQEVVAPVPRSPRPPPTPPTVAPVVATPPATLPTATAAPRPPPSPRGLLARGASPRSIASPRPLNLRLETIAIRPSSPREATPAAARPPSSGAEIGQRGSLEIAPRSVPEVALPPTPQIATQLGANLYEERREPNGAKRLGLSMADLDEDDADEPLPAQVHRSLLCESPLFQWTGGAKSPSNAASTDITEIRCDAEPSSQFRTCRNGGSSSTACACGQAFIPESLFCFKCGAARPAAVTQTQQAVAATPLAPSAPAPERHFTRKDFVKRHQQRQSDEERSHEAGEVEILILPNDCDQLQSQQQTEILILPEVGEEEHAAAASIQACYRGNRGRKELALRESGHEDIGSRQEFGIPERVVENEGWERLSNQSDQAAEELAWMAADVLMKDAMPTLEEEVESPRADIEVDLLDGSPCMEEAANDAARCMVAATSSARPPEIAELTELDASSSSAEQLQAHAEIADDVAKLVILGASEFPETPCWHTSLWDDKSDAASACLVVFQDHADDQAADDFTDNIVSKSIEDFVGIGDTAEAARGSRDVIQNENDEPARDQLSMLSEVRELLAAACISGKLDEALREVQQQDQCVPHVVEEDPTDMIRDTRDLLAAACVSGKLDEALREIEQQGQCVPDVVEEDPNRLIREARDVLVKASANGRLEQSMKSVFEEAVAEEQAPTTKVLREDFPTAQTRRDDVHQKDVVFCRARDVLIGACIDGRLEKATKEVSDICDAPCAAPQIHISCAEACPAPQIRIQNQPSRSTLLREARDVFAESCFSDRLEEVMKDVFGDPEVSGDGGEDREDPAVEPCREPPPMVQICVQQAVSRDRIVKDTRDLLAESCLSGKLEQAMEEIFGKPQSDQGYSEVKAQHSQEASAPDASGGSLCESQRELRSLAQGLFANAALDGTLDSILDEALEEKPKNVDRSAIESTPSVMRACEESQDACRRQARDVLATAHVDGRLDSAIEEALKDDEPSSRNLAESKNLVVNTFEEAGDTDLKVLSMRAGQILVDACFSGKLEQVMKEVCCANESSTVHQALPITEMVAAPPQFQIEIKKVPDKTSIVHDARDLFAETCLNGKLEQALREIMGNTTDENDSKRSSALREQAQDVPVTAVAGGSSGSAMLETSKVGRLDDAMCCSAMNAANAEAALDVEPLDLSLDFLGEGYAVSSTARSTVCGVTPIGGSSCALDDPGSSWDKASLSATSPRERSSHGALEAARSPSAEQPTVDDLLRLQPADLQWKQWKTLQDRLNEQGSTVPARGDECVERPTRVLPGSELCHSPLSQQTSGDGNEGPPQASWLRERWNQMRPLSASRPASRSSNEVPPPQSIKELTSKEAFEQKLMAVRACSPEESRAPVGGSFGALKIQAVPLTKLPPPPDFDPPTCPEVTQHPHHLQALLSACRNP